MDGSNRTLIVTGVKRPSDITLDYKESLIFWVDTDSSVIECADFLGRNRRTIASSLSKPFALTQFQDYIYWTDWNTESIERANKTTGLNRTRIRSNVDFVMDIIVFHTTRQEGGSLQLTCALFLHVRTVVYESRFLIKVLFVFFYMRA